ncbi:hypothetical protein [Rhizobium giardinii]|uniref:Uncharacterized protein n=1 Tax=Rhizobium giardinii TaxID=56731 RepID=A0A7W8UED7_9HYPH|nr:hypothetical protein [Rhizobium giardinii]
MIISDISVQSYAGLLKTINYFVTQARSAYWLLAPAGSGSVVAFLSAQRGAMVVMHDEEQGAGSGP